MSKTNTKAKSKNKPIVRVIAILAVISFLVGPLMMLLQYL